MRVAIMQPYFVPYIGYFQLIAAVDRFVIYDTVQHTKKGWINRNRILRGGEPVALTLPLAKAAEGLDVRERSVSASFEPERLRAQIANAYRGAPHFQEAMPVVDSILAQETRDLFAYLRVALERVCAHLAISTPILIASQVEGSSNDAGRLRGQERVLDICARLGATTYVNPIGGLALYDSHAFSARGVALRFLRARSCPYPQFEQCFAPWLSIIDVMMFNPMPAMRAMLDSGYDLVTQEEDAGCSVGASSDGSSTPGQ